MASICRAISLWAVSVATLAAATSAQQLAPTSDWANLSQIAPGSEIRVTLAAGTNVRGFVQRVTPDSLELNSTTGQETL